MKLFRLLQHALALTLLLSTAACTVTEPDFIGPKAWALSSMERVRLGEWETLDSRISTTLFAAKNEYEAFQINIRAPRSGLTSVNVEVSDFTHDSGYKLPPAELYRQHYVRVSRKMDVGTVNPNPSLGTGWYPDGLIPFASQAEDERLRGAPFNVQRGRNQPVWVDIYVPKDAPAGTYSSRYTVISGEGSVSGEVTLTIWDFTLPDTPTLNSTFLIWESRDEATRAELLRHRLMPRHTPPEQQDALRESYGLKMTGLEFWSGANFETCQMDLAPSVETLRERREQQREGIRVYNYSADEIDRCAAELVDDLRAWGRNLHAAGIEQLVVMVPFPDLYDDGTGRSSVDIWVMSGRMFREVEGAPERLQEALDLGTEVWSYTALAHEDPSPKWGIEFAPTNYRVLQGFINPLYDLTGLLYWRVDDWSRAPWFQLTPERRDYPVGEGMLVYPAEPLGLPGVAPSMRLKWIREGVEDYEYVELLRQLGREDTALSITREVAKSWQSWNTDPEAMLAARKKLAEAILANQ